MAYDLIVAGAGAAGMMAAIRAARDGRKVLLLEKLPKIGTKLKATGGGRCNLSNMLDNESFMESFGKNGRFISRALEEFDHSDLTLFLESIGVKSHAPDGFRIFPLTHDSQTVLDAMKIEMERLNIEVLTSARVKMVICNNSRVEGIETDNATFRSKNIIIATGGMGYPSLGAEGDGYELAKSTGHKVTQLYPAMMPLKTKEEWVARCRADTIPKAHLVVDIKKHRKLQAKGDLIFTKTGIRGPVVLDFSREITPLLAKMNEVPLKMNLTKGLNEERIREKFKKELSKNPHINTIELVKTVLPESLLLVLCELSGIDPYIGISKQAGAKRDKLYKLLAWTPLTVTGHDGFKMAMITRGGVSLKDIDPNTMQSKKINGLYFCGEVVDLDGPCGGYNLQWSFSSGHLAGGLGG